MRIVAAALIGGTVACASCAPVVKPQPVAKSIPACITAKFYARPASFDPAKSIPPSTDDMTDLNDAKITDQLAAALNLADERFIHRLCHDVTYILVDKNDPNGTFAGAYAFWQTKAQANPPVRFISIPLGVFNNPQKYSSYEQALLNAVIGARSYMVTATAPAGLSSSDTDAAALLAMIAHEEGHIIWQRHLRRNADNHKNCPPDQIDYNAYSWSNVGNVPPYHRFNTAVGAKHNNEDPAPIAIRMAADSYGAKRATNATNADRLVSRLYSNTNFASVFAALAPDEDAAEAYKYHVIRRVPSGIGLNLQLPQTGASIPAFAHLDGGKNAEKEKCLSADELDDS
jgi:hypothetical protein